MLKGIELLPHLYKQEVQARMQVFSSPRMPFDETKQCIVHLLLASYQLCRVVKVVIHRTAHAVHFRCTPSQHPNVCCCYPEEKSKEHLLSPSAPASIIVPIVLPLLLRVVFLPLVLNEIRCETTNNGADDSITLTMLFVASELSGC